MSSRNQARDDASGDNDPLDLSNRAHRQLIGYLGLLLPFLLVGLAGLRTTSGVPRWTLLGSVSAYYYTGAVAGFAGILFALSLFLFTYRGYEDDRADRIAGGLGGLCALCVALFPTSPPEGVFAPGWWSPTTRTIHYVAAALLFVVFIVFAVWLFRKTDVPPGQPLPPDKRGRNRFFLGCGIVMTVCVLWAGSSLFTGAPIFWPETLALWAFAASWLVKGGAHRSVTRAARAAQDALAR